MTPQSALRTLSTAATVALATLAFASPLSAETVDTIKKSFNVQPGGRIAVDVDAGSIEVKTGAGNTVAVEVVRKFRGSSEDKEKDMLARQEVTIEQSGDDVHIRARSQGTFTSGGFWSWFGRGTNRDIRYTITVPRNYHAELKTAGGPIAVKELQGDIQAHTSGGPLHFASIHGNIDGGTSGGPIHLERCRGDVTLHTSGGGIDVDDGEGSFKLETSGGGISIDGHRGALSVHTSGGGVHIARVDGSVDASSSGGPVTASFVAQPTGDCRLHTSGGGVSLEVPANARIVLDAHSSGGGVNCSLSGGTDLEKSRGKLRATYNGGGPRMELSTSGGGIDVKTSRGIEG